jgi:hypothetical protein
MRRTLLLATTLSTFVGGCSRSAIQSAGTNAGSSTSRSVAASRTDSPGTSRSNDSDESDTTIAPFDRQWDPGRADEARPRSRFFARVHAVSGNLLVLLFDSTANNDPNAAGGRKFFLADSVSVSYRAGEMFSYLCTLGGSYAIGRVGGLSSSSNPELWIRPRLAWNFDTVSKRIRPVPADSVTCALSEPD